MFLTGGMRMNGVNKTLYIPLYGKALVSQKGIILQDPKAEEIWQAEGFQLKGKPKSKWLAYYMGMRAAVFDQWLRQKVEEYPDSVIVHLGCGMDSRCQRIGKFVKNWFDIDFPEVIAERRRYYSETEHYKMLSCDLRDQTWLSQIPKDRTVLILAEGVTMYLTLPELEQFSVTVCEAFPDCHILMDFYTTFAARVSKYKNPINAVGVTQVSGLDDPSVLSFRLVKEQDMTPENLINQLSAMEAKIFRSVYAGKFSKRLYKLYEFTT